MNNEIKHLPNGDFEVLPLPERAPMYAPSHDEQVYYSLFDRVTNDFFGTVKVPLESNSTHGPARRAIFVGREIIVNRDGFVGNLNAVFSSLEMYEKHGIN